jgi:phytoene/squalene synthetase
MLSLLECTCVRQTSYLATKQLMNYFWMQVLMGMHSPSCRWRQFMSFQIARARQLFQEAESGVDLLDDKARWPVW